MFFIKPPMRNLKIILILFALLIVSAFFYSLYLGVFSKITVDEKVDGGYKLVGLEFKGPYSKAGQFMAEVDEKLSAYDIRSQRSFGIYYDNPKNILPANCRSFVGVVLEKEDIDKIQKLKFAGFKVDSISKANSIVSYFPIKSSLSYMIGAMKVYPKLTKYMNAKVYSSSLSLEIYDKKNKKITFVMQYISK